MVRRSLRIQHRFRMKDDNTFVVNAVQESDVVEMDVDNKQELPASGMDNSGSVVTIQKCDVGVINIFKEAPSVIATNVGEEEELIRRGKKNISSRISGDSSDQDILVLELDEENSEAEEEVVEPSDKKMRMETQVAVPNWVGEKSVETGSLVDDINNAEEDEKKNLHDTSEVNLKLLSSLPGVTSANVGPARYKQVGDNKDEQVADTSDDLQVGDDSDIQGGDTRNKEGGVVRNELVDDKYIQHVGDTSNRNVGDKRDKQVNDTRDNQMEVKPVLVDNINKDPYNTEDMIRNELSMKLSILSSGITIARVVGDGPSDKKIRMKTQVAGHNSRVGVMSVETESPLDDNNNAEEEDILHDNSELKLLSNLPGVTIAKVLGRRDEQVGDTRVNMSDDVSDIQVGGMRDEQMVKQPVLIDKMRNVLSMKLPSLPPGISITSVVGHDIDFTKHSNSPQVQIGKRLEVDIIKPQSESITGDKIVDLTGEDDEKPGSIMSPTKIMPAGMVSSLPGLMSTAPPSGQHQGQFLSPFKSSTSPRKLINQSQMFSPTQRRFLSPRNKSPSTRKFLNPCQLASPRQRRFLSPNPTSSHPGPTRNLSPMFGTNSAYNMKLTGLITPPRRFIHPSRLMSPRLTSPRLTSPRMTFPRMTFPRMTSPRMTSPMMTSPLVSFPRMSSPRMSSPRMSSPRMTTPRMTSPRMTTPRMTTPPIPRLPLLTSPGVALVLPNGPGEVKIQLNSEQVQKLRSELKGEAGGKWLI